MRKKLLAGFIAVPMAFATLVGLTGCDLIDAITGGDDDDESTGGVGSGGGMLTEQQWEDAFGDSQNYVNFTTNLQGSVTVNYDGKTMKQNATGIFRVDGNKNYTKSVIKGDENATMEIYEYRASSETYNWFRGDEEGVWEREQVNGLLFSAIMLEDYSPYYDCFTYNSSSKRYEATPSGLRILAEVTAQNVMGELPSEGVNIELRECSFAIANGLPCAASMNLVLTVNEHGMSMQVAEDIDYTFTDFGKTVVTFPTQIVNELKELGEDPDKEDPTPGKDPEKPTPGGSVSGEEVNESEWYKAFEELRLSMNYTASLSGTMSQNVNGKPMQSSLTGKFMIDGEKFYSESESSGYTIGMYGLNRSGKTYYWTNNDGSGWTLSSQTIPMGGSDAVLNEDYSNFYRYVKFNSKTGVYEATREGLEILTESVADAIASSMAGVQGMNVSGEVTKYTFAIKNDAVYAIDMTVICSMSAYGTSVTVTENMQYIFSDINKTNVKFPSKILADIEKIEAGDIPDSGNTDNPEEPPVDNPPVENPDKSPVASDEVTERQWRRIFSAEHSQNYSAELNGTISAKITGSGVNQEFDGTTNGFIAIDADKTYSVNATTIMGETSTTEAYQLITDSNVYGWEMFNEGNWRESDSKELNVIPLEDFADSYNCFEYDFDAQCYVSTAVGTEMLQEIMNQYLVSYGGVATFTLDSVSFAVSDGVPVWMNMHFTVTQNSQGMVVTMGYSASYEFRDFGTTQVVFPDEIVELIDNAGI